MTPEEFEILNKKCPFLSYVNFQDTDYIGIIQNVDNQMTSIYVYSDLVIEEEKKNFLALGLLWWENSNRQIPINIFLKNDFKIYQKVLRCLPKKDISETSGPIVSLDESFQRRIKKKRVQLIRDMK